MIGSPEAGLTNQQNFDKYGIATFGIVSSTTDDTSRPEIFGYTSPILTPTTPRVVFVTPWHGAGLAAADPVRIRYTVNGQMPSNAKIFFTLDYTRKFDKITDGGLFDVPQGSHELTAYIGDAVTGVKLPGTDETTVQFYIGGDGRTRS